MGIPEHIKADMIVAEDGFYVYWPQEPMGAYTSHSLRQIADELDRLNGPWQAQIDAFFAIDNNS